MADRDPDDADADADALAMAALLLAIPTLLNMSLASDIAEAKVVHSSSYGNLSAVRWSAGTRMVIAAVGLQLALTAAIRYATELPVRRYRFSDGADEPAEVVSRPALVRG